MLKYLKIHNLTFLKEKFHPNPAFFTILDICDKTLLFVIELYNFSKLFLDKNLMLFNICLDAIGDLKNPPYDDFPTCHLLNALVKKFVTLRLFAYEKRLKNQLSQKYNTQDQQ